MDLTGLGSVASLAKGILNKFVGDKASDAEKMAMEAQLTEMLEKRETAVIKAKEGIIISEMQQGDNYTKRARPTLVYAGLFFIFLVHVFTPCVVYVTGGEPPDLTLPEQFWWAWSGCVGIWSLGRSAEKNGSKNSIIQKITGTG